MSDACENKEQLIARQTQKITDLHVNYSEYPKDKTQQMVDLLLEYSDLFSIISAHPGEARGVNPSMTCQYHTEYHLEKEL